MYIIFCEVLLLLSIQYLRLLNLNFHTMSNRSTIQWYRKHNTRKENYCRKYTLAAWIALFAHIKWTISCNRFFCSHFILHTVIAYQYSLLLAKHYYRCHSFLPTNHSICHNGKVHRNSHQSSAKTAEFPAWKTPKGRFYCWPSESGVARWSKRPENKARESLDHITFHQSPSLCGIPLNRLWCPQKLACNHEQASNSAVVHRKHVTVDFGLPSILCILWMGLVAVCAVCGGPGWMLGYCREGHVWVPNCGFSAHHRHFERGGLILSAPELYW